MKDYYDLFQINREKDYDRIPVILDDSVQQIPLIANGRTYAIKIVQNVEQQQSHVHSLINEKKHSGPCVSIDSNDDCIKCTDN